MYIHSIYEHYVQNGLDGGVLHAMYIYRKLHTSINHKYFLSAF